MKASIWHILATAGMALVTAFTPSIQGAISSHATVSAILLAGWTILGTFLQPPNK